MNDLVRRGARTLLKTLRNLAADPKSFRDSPPSHVDYSNWIEEIAGYRAMGARIGEKVRLFGELDNLNPHLIEIGDYCVIGKGSVLLSHCPINGPRPVKIGSFVYIGFGAIILPGVTIGDAAVVGAGAVVTRSVPEGSVVVGNPGRILRELSAEEKNRIRQALLEGKTFADLGQAFGTSVLAS